MNTSFELTQKSLYPQETADRLHNYAFSAVPSPSTLTNFTPDIPDWLRGQRPWQGLRNQLDAVPRRLDVSNEYNQIYKDIGINQAGGLQAANAAAQAEGMRQRAKGGDVNTEALAAGLMLPVMQDSANRKEKAEGILSESKKNIALISADIAKSLATVKSDYLKTMVGLYDTERGRGLDASKFAAELKAKNEAAMLLSLQNQREFDLKYKTEESLDPGFQGTMYTTPNTMGAGGMVPTSAYANYMRRYGNSYVY